MHQMQTSSLHIDKHMFTILFYHAFNLQNRENQYLCIVDLHFVLEEEEALETTTKGEFCDEGFGKILLVLEGIPCVMIFMPRNNK